MSERRALDRREFTTRSLMAMLSGVAVTISGCSGNGPTQSTPVFTDNTGVVSGNHGHSAVITGAQLGDGGAVKLDIQGTASHPHTVELTSAEVLSIRDGRTVEKLSTPSPSGSHSHTITFN
jgi:hypothetical protein